MSHVFGILVKFMFLFLGLYFSAVRAQDAGGAGRRSQRARPTIFLTFMLDSAGNGTPDIARMRPNRAEEGLRHRQANNNHSQEQTAFRGKHYYQSIGDPRDELTDKK